MRIVDVNAFIQQRAVQHRDAGLHQFTVEGAFEAYEPVFDELFDLIVRESCHAADSARDQATCLQPIAGSSEGRATGSSDSRRAELGLGSAGP